MNASNSSRMFWWKAGAAMALFVIACGIYILRAAVTVQESDGGELAAAAILGSTVHPPGYPVYMSCARMLVALFPANPYHTLAVFSGVLQASAAAMLFLLCAAMGNSLLAALGIAAAWLLYEPTMRTATDAEVFALHHCLVIALASACWRLCRTKHIARWALIVGLLSGLGAAHHHAIVLWAPLAAAALLQAGTRDWARARVRAALVCWGAAAIGVLLGLSAYLLLWIGSGDHAALAFAKPDSWHALLGYMFRSEYGTFTMHAGASADQVSALVPFLTRSVSSIPLILIGFVLFLASPRGCRNACILGVGLSALLHLYFSLHLLFPPDTAISGEFSMRFYVMLALAGAIGLGAALPVLPQRAWTPWAIAMLLFVPALARTPRALEGSDNAADRTIDYELEAIMGELPPRALFVGNLDRISMGVRYKQALGERLDILLVPAGMFGSPSFRKPFFANHPEFDPATVKTLKDAVDRARQNGRQVFAYYETSLPPGYARWPIGVTWEWLPADYRPTDAEITARFFAFCARWPDGLGQARPPRQLSHAIVDRIFVKPFLLHLKSSRDEAHFQRYLGAVRSLALSGAAEARETCRAALIEMTGSGSVDPRYYP